MLKPIRLVTNLLRWNDRLREDAQAQKEGKYRISTSNIGPERYITYEDSGREISVIADFAWTNDVRLYVDSLRKWSKPYGESLTDFDFQTVLNRVIHYLSCWGTVDLDYTKLLDNEELKKSLQLRGIPYEERADGVIRYEADSSEVSK